MRLRSLSLVMFLACSLPCSFAAAQPTSEADEEARTLFGLGDTAYQQGRYRAALEYFQQAYDLSHRPQLLFNIGQAADRLRDDARALAAFEAFLAEVPDSPQRSATEARVEILRNAVAARTAAPVQAETTPEPEPAPEPAPSRETQSEGSSVPGLVITSAGGALLVVGAIFVGLGAKDASTVEGARDGSSFSSVEDEYDRSGTRITVGSILAGVGLAATTTGIILAVRGGRDDEPSVAVRVHPNGLSIGGRF